MSVRPRWKTRPYIEIPKVAQPGLLDDVEVKYTGIFDDCVYTLSFDESSLMRNICKLYVPAGHIDLDPTYSIGRVWTEAELPPPRLKFDLYPQTADTVQADVRQLPLADESIASAYFDPPFLARSGDNTKSVMCRRFGVFENMQELYETYRDALRELYRVLQPHGVLIFKCQDTSYDDRNYMVHAAVIYMAQQIGFYVADLFVLGRYNRAVWAKNIKRQYTARKNHCYILVLRKESKKRTALWEMY